jgi:predicted CoA-binding protein
VPNDEEIRNLLTTAKTIAVVGLSNNPMRASFGVSEFMQQKGYRIIPVNPNEKEVLGEPSVGTLEEIQEPIDIVDVFRRSEFVPEIVESAIAKGARCVWMQQGVIHEEAARRAEAAGLLVVMDQCILREYHRLMR